MQVALASDFVCGSAVDTRTVSNVLPTNANMPVPVAQGIAVRLLDKLQWVNTSSLYATGYIMAMQLAQFEEHNIVPAIQAQVAGAFAYHNLAVAANAQQALLTMMNDDLDVGAFVFMSHDVSDSLLNILQAPASGLPRFNVPAGSPVLLSSCIHSPIIQVRVYGHGPREVQAQLASINADRMLSAVNDIAALSGEQTMAVRGAVRATYMVNGVIVVQAVQHRWVNALLEIDAAIWPRPIDYNWMWRALAIAPNFIAARYLEANHTPLASTTAAQVDWLFGLVAGVINVSFWTGLWSWNLGAPELNAMFGVVAEFQAARTLLRTLLRTSGEAVVPPFMQVFPNVAMHAFGVAINPTCFMTSAAADNLWVALWGQGAPRMVAALSLAWVLNAWVDIWGILPPPVRVDLTHELVVNAELAENRWYADAGKQKYRTHAASALPYRYIPYGGQVYNALSQHFGTRPIRIAACRRPKSSLAGTFATRWPLSTDLRNSPIQTFATHGGRPGPPKSWP